MTTATPATTPQLIATYALAGLLLLLFFAGLALFLHTYLAAWRSELALEAAGVVYARDGFRGLADDTPPASSVDDDNTDNGEDNDNAEDNDSDGVFATAFTAAMDAATPLVLRAAPDLDADTARVEAWKGGAVRPRRRGHNGGRKGGK
ncbi:hypothetical protein EDC01DRAFT_630546 [Geopyxis carbonaria]|nr:hypothetical protein EDC01DRAFT_630546 [Geopyxis carbonaria]